VKPLDTLRILLEHPDLAKRMPEPAMPPSASDDARLAHAAWGLARAGLEVIDLEALAPAYRVRGGASDDAALAAVLMEARHAPPARTHAEDMCARLWPLLTAAPEAIKTTCGLDYDVNLDPPDWLLRDSRDHGAGVPRSCIVLFFADGGMGKGWLLTQLGMAAAMGMKWLTLEPAKPLRVLHLSFEDHADSVMRRQHAVGRMLGLKRGDTADNYIGFHAGMLAGQVLWSDGPTATLREVLDLAADRDIVIVDPLAQAVQGDENDNNAMTHAINGAFSALAASGKLVFLAHHSRKGGTGPDGKDAAAARGASGIMCAARMAMKLDDTPISSPANKRLAKGGHGQAKLVTRRDHDSLWWSVAKCNDGRTSRPIPLQRSWDGPLVFRPTTPEEQEELGWMADGEGNVEPAEDWEGYETTPKVYRDADGDIDQAADEALAPRRRARKS
jgi:hypothetical protein